MASVATPHEPGRLIAQIRAAFVLQGTSLTRWAKDNNTDPSAIRQAIYGTWAGPRGKAMRAKVLKAAGVKEVA